MNTPVSNIANSTTEISLPDDDLELLSLSERCRLVQSLVSTGTIKASSYFGDTKSSRLVLNILWTVGRSQSFLPIIPFISSEEAKPEAVIWKERADLEREEKLKKPREGWDLLGSLRGTYSKL